MYFVKYIDRSLRKTSLATHGNSNGYDIAETVFVIAILFWIVIWLIKFVWLSMFVWLMKFI